MVVALAVCAVLVFWLPQESLYNSCITLRIAARAGAAPCAGIATAVYENGKCPQQLLCVSRWNTRVRMRGEWERREREDVRNMVGDGL